MSKIKRNRWELCSFCQQIKLVAASNHKCPEIVKVKREIEIENVVEQELVMFDIEVDQFWNDPKTKFLEYLADQGEI